MANLHYIYLGLGIRKNFVVLRMAKNWRLG